MAAPGAFITRGASSDRSHGRISLYTYSLSKTPSVTLEGLAFAFRTSDRKRAGPCHQLVDRHECMVRSSVHDLVDLTPLIGDDRRWGLDGEGVRELVVGIREDGHSTRCPLV